MARVNFDKQTVDALKIRAAFMCSNPECRCSTVAPSAVNEKDVIFNGIASHIAGAASGGPRYDATLSDAEIGDIKNGIFLCANCSIMIDKNNGQDYSISQLQDWKSAHEKFVFENFNKKRENQLSEVNGEISASGIGTVIGLEINKPTRIMPGTKITATGIGNVTGTKIGG
jgi:hypothetical protein